MEQEMINRLKEILDYFRLSPSKLADDISINRSRLSHILNGRNNPTLEVVQGILNKYKDINPDWLLFGQGTMIRVGIEPTPKDLFQYAEVNKKKKQQVIEPVKADNPIVASTQIVVDRNDDKPPKTSLAQCDGALNSGIKRITVYYNNNEYQEFIPGK